MASQCLPQHRVAVLTKTGDQLPRPGIDREQPVVAVHEDAPLAALAPGGDTAMVVVEVDARAVQVGLRIERPSFRARFRVQRNDTIERRAQVQHVVDHEGRRLKIPGLRPIR